MKTKYYTSFFSFRLPIYIVGCLLVACSKLDSRYHNKMKSTIVNIEGPSSKRSKSATPSVLSLSDPTEELFKAIRASQVDEVKELLENQFYQGENILYLCKTDVDGNTCLHIAAGINQGDEDKQARIMALLLDKMKFLFLCENSWLEATCIDVKKKCQHSSREATCRDVRKCKGSSLEAIYKYPNKLERLVEDSTFWTIHNIPMQKIQKDIFDRLGTNPLLVENNDGEIPLMVAMKHGNLNVFKCLLEFTHKSVGLQVICYTDKDRLDFLDIALRTVIQKKDDSKLYLILDEFEKCITSRYYGHLGDPKCLAEEQVKSFFISKSKLLFKLACTEETSNCYKKLFKTINHIVGFGDFIFWFLRFHTTDRPTDKSAVYLLRLMEHNPECGFESKIVKYLCERLDLINSPELKKQIRKFRNECHSQKNRRLLFKPKPTSNETWLRTLPVKLREEYAMNVPSNPSGMHVKCDTCDPEQKNATWLEPLFVKLGNENAQDAESSGKRIHVKFDIYNEEQEFELFMEHFKIDYKFVDEFNKTVLDGMLCNR